MSFLRGRLKRSAEALLVRSRLAAVARKLQLPYALVLAYHNVVPDDFPRAGDRSLHMPRGDFAVQLDVLTCLCDVVPLDGILEAPKRFGKPLAAITLDDAYRGALTIGLNELASRRLPATYFVAPRMLGGRTFWWDVLADRRAGEVPVPLRQYALESRGGNGEEVLRWAQEASLDKQVVPPEAVTASEDDLRRAARVPGITMASHSWNHPNLTRLAPQALDAELAQPLSWLRQRFDSAIPWLAFPYGLSSPAVEAATARAGYKAAVLIRGGVLRSQASEYAIPRVNVPAGISEHGFELRLSALAR